MPRCLSHVFNTYAGCSSVAGAALPVATNTSHAQHPRAAVVTRSSRRASGGVIRGGVALRHGGGRAREQRLAEPRGGYSYFLCDAIFVRHVMTGRGAAGEKVALRLEPENGPLVKQAIAQYQ